MINIQNFRRSYTWPTKNRTEMLNPDYGSIFLEDSHCNNNFPIALQKTSVLRKNCIFDPWKIGKTVWTGPTKFGFWWKFVRLKLTPGPICWQNLGLKGPIFTVLGGFYYFCTPDPPKYIHIYIHQISAGHKHGQKKSYRNVEPWLW